jgi:hypothetical protein
MTTSIPFIVVKLSNFTVKQVGLFTTIELPWLVTIETFGVSSAKEQKVLVLSSITIAKITANAFFMKIPPNNMLFKNEYNNPVFYISINIIQEFNEKVN